MSIAEIADNRWELEASRPPIRTLSGIAQIIFMGFLSLFFLGIILTAIAGVLTTPPATTLGESTSAPSAGAANPAAAPAP